MMLYLALQLTLLVVGISIVTRVWRASALDGVLCLIVPLYVLIAMVKHWKDPDHDIRYHVLLLFVLAFGVVWVQFRAAHEIVADAAATQAARREYARALASRAGTDEDPDQAGGESASDAPPDDDEVDRPTPPAPVVSLGGAARATRDARAPAPAPASRSREPDTPARALLPEETAPPTLRQTLAAATFQRGVFERTTLGFAIDLPGHFHALAANDVRRIERSSNLPADPHEIAWVVHESVALDAPDAWHVRVRWHSDGWVPPSAAPDGWRLLQQAQRGGGTTHLAGSGGDLVGYAIAPRFDSGMADWVEERLPAGAGASVLDCHALRLGRRGVVEFSVVGALPGSQTLCDASVRLLARSTRFERGADYSPAATDAPRAPYSLAELVGGTR